MGEKGLPALQDVDLEVRAGEVLGIAGVAGNGQSELAEVVTGLRQVTGGIVQITGADLTNRSAAEIARAGVAHIPEDRLATGLIGGMDIAENAILRDFAHAPLSHGPFIAPRAVADFTDRLIAEHDIKTPGRWAKLRTLSGGNQQKLLLARELAGSPRLIVAVHPTRGVDVGASETIHEALRGQRARGAATLLISEDLDELLALSDRIAVLFAGRRHGHRSCARRRSGAVRPSHGGDCTDPLGLRGVGRWLTLALPRGYRVERVSAPSRTATALVSLLSIVLALLFGGLLLALAGQNPLIVYRAMLAGALGDWNGVAETLVKTTPLLLAGLGVAVAFRMQLWNIGAEGQLYWGAIFATGTALFVIPFAPGWLMVPAMIVAALIGGGIWGLIPGALRAWFGASEIISSLMLNYVAILFSEYLVHGPWRDPQAYGFPGTPPLPDAAWLPHWGTTRVHLGLLFGLAAALVLWLVLRRTRWGYEIGVMGENPRAALYAGMPTKRNILLVMALSGALAGLAGMSEVAGIGHQLQRNLSPGYGYAAIIVAWLARLHPFGAVLVAFLLAALTVGGDQLQMSLGLPAAIAPMLQGTILFFLLGGDALTRYRLVKDLPLPAADAVATPQELI